MTRPRYYVLPKPTVHTEAELFNSLQRTVHNRGFLCETQSLQPSSLEFFAFSPLYSFLTLADLPLLGLSSFPFQTRSFLGLRLLAS